MILTTTGGPRAEAGKEIDVSAQCYGLRLELRWPLDFDWENMLEFLQELKKLLT